MSLLDVHVGLTFSAIAPLLGLEPTAKHTVSAECPFCGAHAWAIYQDTHSLEEWHYCSQCKATGSMLAMAAERLQMPQVEALQYLANKLNYRLQPADIKDYTDSLCVDRTYLDLWKLAQDNMLRLTDAQNRFIREKRWHPTAPMSTPRIMSGPAQIYGIASPSQLSRVLSNKFHRRSQEVLVVPYYRTPTQIGSFACISATQQFYTRRHTIKSEFRPGSFGFAGLPLLWRSYSDSVIVTSMLSNMIQLQMSNFRSSDIPLPLLGWRQPSKPGRQRQWELLDGRHTVFWERTPTAAIVHQAMLCEGHLVFLGPETDRRKPQEVEGDRWDNWISKQPALDAFKLLLKEAKPVGDALRNWARVAAEEDKVRLRQDAVSFDSKVAELIWEAVPAKQNVQRSRRANVPIQGNKKQESKGHTVIVENDHKWLSLEGRMRLPFTVRVTHVVARPGGRRDYIGFLLDNKNKVSFVVDSKKAGFGWLEKFAKQHNMWLPPERGTNIHRDRRVDTFDPFDAAMVFESPKLVAGVSSVGWDGSGFQFLKARLLNSRFRPNPEFLLPENSPGPRRSHCRFRREVYRSLNREGPEMEVAWAFAIALCAQVTAPVVDLPVVGITIDRQQHDRFLSSLYSRFEIRKGDYSSWPHKWPRRLDLLDRAIKEDKTGFYVSRHTGQPRQVIKVDARDESLDPSNLSWSVDKLTLNYLKYFTSLKTARKRKPENWNEWLNFTLQRFSWRHRLIKSQSLASCFRRIEYCS